MEGRIFHVQSIVEAAAHINREFSSRLPVPLRGAIASLTGTIDLSWREGDTLTELKVKGIDQILTDGTELDYENEFGWTRVDSHAIARLNWACIYAMDRTRIDQWTERARISPKTGILLKPVILVYDKTFLTIPPRDSVTNPYNVKLPNRPEDRAKAILALYVNDTNQSEAHIDPAF
ncbi:MAG: hypothetical protein ABIA93_07365 [Candidatus Woesearchaeota archaeon]